MKSLKRLGASAVLSFAFAVAAFAGDPQQPCLDPGQTGTMPCSAAQIASDDAATTGESSSFHFPDSVEAAITVTATHLLQSVLLLY